MAVNARRGDVDDVLATIDKFATEESMLVNVGDEKGELLDAAEHPGKFNGADAPGQADPRATCGPFILAARIGWRP